MLELNFTPFPELTTSRLLLRRLKKEDAPDLFLLRSDEKVLQYIGREPAVSVIEVEKFIEKIQTAQQNNESILWGIAFADKPGIIIGTMCYWRLQPENYRAEIGYALRPEYWGKGIITEAINKVVEYGFNTMKLHSIEARTTPANVASGLVLEKTGFLKEGLLKEEFFFNGKFYDTVIYSRLQDQH
jgi:ribosomal-protein-alanine N-acetyltransferase